MLFYDTLFSMAPQVRPLLKGDVVERGKKLMATLNIVVNGLNDLESIISAAQRLGRAHVDYGVENGHYDYVGAALLYVLE